ncbi:MAG: nucleotidyltransferase domain-containing protein [Deltaproteobacteria bacterium]|nr:nucleotidyltransferase domain-containing protein [Deltaproteobacteria bacterium]
MKTDLARDTIFVALAGSQAHGTARSGSDVDLRGVCVVPLAKRLSLFETFEQWEGPLVGELWSIVRERLRAHPTASEGLGVKTEAVVFDVAKFLRLCANANPNALEILFADARDWLYESVAWKTIHAARFTFLTRRVQETYLGYAMAQLKKIRTHRSWLLNPPTHKPTRAEFGLPEVGAMSRDERNRIELSIAEKVRAYGIDDLDMPKHTRVSFEERLDALMTDALATPEDQLDERLRAVASSALRLPAAVVEVLSAERRYRAAMSHWESYRSWQSQRNPARAELESKFGYDTKHGMHLLRLMRTGLEVLERGDLLVRRADAAELSAVRDGALGFEALVEEAEALRARMSKAAETCRLPRDSDKSAVDALAAEVMLGCSK